MDHADYVRAYQDGWRAARNGGVPEEAKRRADAYDDLFGDASPDEIRILSGLVRAMREIGRPPPPTRPEAYAECSREGVRKATSGAWHIALALDALSKEST